MDKNPGNGSQKLRNARACETCRASKSRCFFEDAEQKVCTRCEQAGYQCIVRTKARPMRTRTVRPTSGSVKNITPRVGDPEFSINLPSVSAPNSIKDVLDLHDHHKQFFGEAEDVDLRSAAQDKRPRLIEQRKLSLKEAEQLLVIYRQKAIYFPFVLIPPEATVPTLARTSPFTLLAIFTAASVLDPSLRHQMDHEFRRILSTKVIVTGQKSLDFLQGLLVYISWYPLHSKPKNSQAFMYINLAIGLSLDLGLDRETPTPGNFTTINTTGLIENGEFTPAAKRAYLGTYYMSSALSMGFQKPNNLEYRNLMDAHGESLLDNEGSSEIKSLVDLQRLAEKIAVHHRTKGPEANDPMAAEMTAQMFQSELEAWKQRTPLPIRNLPHIALFSRFVGIHIYSHELGFLRKPYRSHIPTITQTSSPTHLTACLTASKQFFTHLLSLPEHLYAHFSVFQWSKMVQATLILSRLTFVMAAQFNWDAERTREEVPLVMYLDALMFRFQALSTTKGSPSGEVPKNPDILYVFKMILGSVKKSYAKRVDAIQPHFMDTKETEKIARGHCPIMDPGLNDYWDNDLGGDMNGLYNGNGYGSGSQSESWDFSTPDMHGGLDSRMGDRSWDTGSPDTGFGTGSSDVGMGSPSTGLGGTPNSRRQTTMGMGMDMGLGMGTMSVNGGGVAMDTLLNGPIYYDLWATMTGSWAEEI